MQPGKGIPGPQRNNITNVKDYTMPQHEPQAGMGGGSILQGAIKAIPIIGPILNAAGEIFNIGGGRKAHKRQRDFYWETYERSRQDALSDWARQNEYNSPIAQMARLRQAGLNPNLVYDNGAQMASATTRPASGETMSMVPPQVNPNNIGNSINAIYDLKIKEAQYSNLQQQNTNLVKDAFIKDAQVNNIQANTYRTLTSGQDIQFDLGQKQRLADVSADYKEALLNNQLKDLDVKDFGMDMQWLQNARAEMANARAERKTDAEIRQIQEAIIRSRWERTKTPYQIQVLQQQLQNLKKDATHKDWINALNASGATEQDFYFIRQAITEQNFHR